MNKKTVGKPLKQRVIEWLKSQKAVYWTSLGDAKFDFLIVKPFPIAIELKKLPDMKTVERRARHILADRINFADNFQYVPLIFIVPELPKGLLTRKIPLFVDAIFSVNDLPSLSQLRKQRLDAKTQEIIKRGDPGDVVFTEPQQFATKWADALSLEEIFDGGDFPENSLAAKMHTAALEALQYERAHKSSSSSPPSELDSIIQSSHFHKRFDEMLHTELTNLVGGRLGYKRIYWVPEDKSKFWNIRVWKDENHRVLVLRWQMVDGKLNIPSLRELTAESWMLRAFGNVPKRNFVLLVGSKTTWKSKTGEIMDICDLEHVNYPESAGWQVLPWDFAEEVPQFVSYLRRWKENY
jgi:hypothetical protein